PYLVEVSLQVGFELLDCLPVHAGRTLVGFDRFVRFVHSPFLDRERLVCRIRRRHPVSSCFAEHDHLTRPLCSSPITGPSTLLRVDPSQSPALASRFSPLVLLPCHQGLVPAVPRKSLRSYCKLCCDLAGYCLAVGETGDGFGGIRDLARGHSAFGRIAAFSGVPGTGVGRSEWLSCIPAWRER